MDIAEIRKKAKAGKRTEENVKERPKEHSLPTGDAPDTGEDTFDLAEPDDSPATDDSPTEPTVPSSAKEKSHQDALDRLFAADSGFELATEEAYQEALSDRAEEQTQAVSQYLAFQLGREEYALDIQQISEIIKVREFTDIPRAPEFILGIISLRGVVVPVFDLCRRFQLGQAEITSTSRIVVCQWEEIIAGLLVDSINQVITLADERMEPPPAVLSGIDRELVEGVGRYEGRMIIVLHLESVLDVALM